MSSRTRSRLLCGWIEWTTRRGLNKHIARRLRAEVSRPQVFGFGGSGIGSRLHGRKKKKKLSSGRRQSSLSADHVRAIPWNWPVFRRGGWREKISYAFLSHSQCFLDVSPCTVKKEGNCDRPEARIDRKRREGVGNKKLIFLSLGSTYLLLFYNNGYWITTLVMRKVDLYRGSVRKKSSKITIDEIFLLKILQIIFKKIMKNILYYFVLIFITKMFILISSSYLVVLYVLLLSSTHSFKIRDTAHYKRFQQNNTNHPAKKKNNYST